MQSQTYPLLDFVPVAAYTIAGIVAATILIVKLRKRPNVCKEHSMSGFGP